MSNDSGHVPVGPRVLVLPDTVPTKIDGSMFDMLPDEVKREQAGQTVGLVVAKGATANDWCKVGDRITYSRYAGQTLKGKDGKEYRTIRDIDQVTTEDSDHAS